MQFGAPSALRLSPGCPGPMCMALSLASPGLPGGMGFCMELLVGRCWGSAQASFGGLVMGRMALAEGITAASRGRDTAGVGDLWWPCPTPRHAQPPAQETLSSCRTGAVSHTLGIGHLAGHRLPAEPTLSPSTQKQGHRVLEPLAGLAAATQQ